LGYIPYAYYPPNKGQIKAVPVEWDKNPAAKGPVAPSEETVLKGTYNPLSRPLFIYVRRQAVDRPEVKEFVEFFLKEGPQLVREVRYVPVPDEAYEKGLERLEKLQTGTAFGGKAAIGLPVEDILKLEPKP
jgi:phosphate transport system substrate-binding protein